MYGAPGTMKIYASFHRQARRRRQLAQLLRWLPLAMVGTSGAATLAALVYLAAHTA